MQLQALLHFLPRWIHVLQIYQLSKIWFARTSPMLLKTEEFYPEFKSTQLYLLFFFFFFPHVQELRNCVCSLVNWFALKCHRHCSSPSRSRLIQFRTTQWAQVSVKTAIPEVMLMVSFKIRHLPHGFTNHYIAWKALASFT